MRPTGNMRDGPGPTAFNSMLASTYESDRDRGEARRHEHRRAVVGGQADHVSIQARVMAVVRGRVRLAGARADDHSLTDYPCRLPDGRLGQVAVIRERGDWVMVCRTA